MSTRIGQRIRDIRQGPDGFIYLVLQSKSGFAAEYFPLLYVGTNVAFLAPVPLLTAFVAYRIYRSLQQGHHVAPFLLAIAARNEFSVRRNGGIAG